MSERDVNIKLTADTNEAKRSIRDLERQVDKLGDLADQGERRQKGFLSERQVKMYRRIMREMEQTYQTHLNNLGKMEDRYNSRKNSQESKKLKQLEQELQKRQRLLRNAEGGNRWGDVSSPIIQEYHRSKLSEAQQALSEYRNSDEMKRHADDLKEMEAQLNTMRTAVRNLESGRSRGQMHADRINSMHQLSPNTRHMVEGAARTVATTGTVLGFNTYWGYSMDGIDKLREQERQSQGVVSSLGNMYYGVKNADAQHRELIQPVGMESNYSTMDTAMLQRTLLSGGTSGDINALNSDTVATQKFGRSFQQDPNEIAGYGALLQRMGSLNEGEQQRFANLIAGAISKNKMGGREQEMMRATMSLAQNASRGQTALTKEDLTNLVSLQTQLGQAVPELKGERGAQLLSTIDSAFKTGGSQMDVVMGRGVLPEFSGVNGYMELQKLKERGLTDPRTAQYFFKGLDRMYGDGPNSEALKATASKEQLGITIDEYETLRDSGLLQRIKKGEKISSKDLQKAGAVKLAKQWDTYQGSETQVVDSMNAHKDNRQADHAKAYDEVAKFGRDTIFNNMPEWAQHGSLVGGGILGGLFAGQAIRTGSNWLLRRMAPTVGQSATGAGGWRGMLERFGRGGGNPPTPPTATGAGASPRLSGLVDVHGNPIPSSLAGGASGVSGSASAMSKLKSFGSSALETAGKAGARIPIAGALIGTGVDRMVNPENDWGRSLAKGIGGAIGGTLAGGAAVASGFFTGGLGWLGTGAAAVGGGMAGEKAGDWVYSLFNGDGDKVKPASVPKDDASNIDTKIKEATERAKKIDEKIGSFKSEHSIKITIDGSIQGMNKNNEKEVKDSVKSFWQKFFGNDDNFSNRKNNINLSFDQTRD